MKEIIAKEGYWLTQKTLEDETSRTFASKVFTANEDLWKEVDNEFKENWEKEHPAPEPPEVPNE